MLLVTNRPSVYVVVDGKTVEMEVDKPMEVPEKQCKTLLDRGICMVFIEAEPEPEPKSKKK